MLWDFWYYNGNVMESAKKPKILLVEDNIINQRVVVLTLKHLNFECDVASNGKEAFEKFCQNEYDLIFMDIQMPVLNGLEATKLIRNYEKSTGSQKPVLVIALTANEPTEFSGMYLEAGMDGFIEKPLRIEQLSTYIGQLLNSRISETTSTE